MEGKALALAVVFRVGRRARSRPAEVKRWAQLLCADGADGVLLDPRLHR